MKQKTKFVIVFSLIIGCLFFSSTTFGQSKLRVAVVAFENNSTWSYWGDNLGNAAADVFVTALLATGKFSMIERDKVDIVLAEQDFGDTGRITPQTAAQIGKMLGVDLLLTGSITQFSISLTGGEYEE
ncbi:MAG: CsgG/HfaB family protein [Candidatus Aminicenantes bacterium]|nr:CsgG/HfaB family protein [Candidatus Aminicenantes bacterium]